MRISSAAVPQSALSPYLEYVRSTEIPRYEAATGLMSVSLLQRPFGAYVELLTLSIWQSEQALTRFVEKQPPADGVESEYGVIQFEPRTYESVVSRDGKLRDDEDLQQEQEGPE